MVTLSVQRGAERHPIRVVGVVVVAATVRIDIPEVVGVGGIRRTEPPVGSRTVTKCAEHNL